MAWPKGKPRNAAVETRPSEPALVDLNAAYKKRRAVEIAKRDACIAEMMKPYFEAYGGKNTQHIRRFLADLIDGKPIAGMKPKPLRILPRKKEAA